MIGTTLSGFNITAKLGEGGMGEVYRATDTKLGREVAIKVLPEEFVADAERLARFEREAKVLAALDHPSIAAIYGLEEVDGRQLLIMQLAEGETLQERIAKGPVPLDQALPIALQIAEALEAAHAEAIRPGLPELRHVLRLDQVPQPTHVRHILPHQLVNQAPRTELVRWLGQILGSHAHPQAGSDRRSIDGRTDLVLIVLAVEEVGVEPGAASLE